MTAVELDLLAIEQQALAAERARLAECERLLALVNQGLTRMQATVDQMTPAIPARLRPTNR